jgi:hypothetical protein
MITLVDRIEQLEEQVVDLLAMPRRGREKAPSIRGGCCWHLRIGDRATGVSPHIHVNCYNDDPVPSTPLQARVCEVWIELDDKDRHTLGGGLADAAATMLSMALQHGAPLCELAQKLVGLRGGCGGPVWTRATPEATVYVPDREVSRCTSLLDCLGKKLLVRFCGDEPYGPREDQEP